MPAAVKNPGIGDRGRGVLALGGDHQPVFYIVRHGATDLNNVSGRSVERIRGWADVPLNADGVQEAERLAAGLVRATPKPTVVFTSDLQRAHETAKIIAQRLGGLPVYPTQALRPWNLGDLTGRSVEEVKPMLAYYIAHSNEPPPQGEPYDAFYQRWSTAVRQVQTIAAHGAVPLMVVHSRNLLSLPRILSNGRDSIAPAGGPAPGQALMVVGNEMRPMPAGTVGLSRPV